MTWRILLLSDRVQTAVPYKTLVGYMRARATAGSKFRVGHIEPGYARFYYQVTRSGWDGYPSGAGTEILIINQPNKKGEVTIRFRMPFSMRIGCSLAIVLFYFIVLYAKPSFGFWRITSLVAIGYVAALAGQCRELYYFEQDLESIEKNYEQTLTA